MKHYSIIQRNKSRGDATWYGRTYDNGVIRYQSLRTKSKMVAKQWLDLMNSSRFLPENYFATAKKDKPITEAIDKFLVHNEGRVSAGSQKVYKNKIFDFKKFCDEKKLKTLRQITKEKANEYNNILTSAISSVTHGDYLVVLGMFQRFCNEVFEMEDWRPFAYIKKPKKVKRAKLFWTLEEIDIILNAAPTKQYRLLWALMAYAGLRYKEAVSVTAMSFVDDRIRIIGKGNKEAFVPISNKLKKELELFGDIIDIDFALPQKRPDIVHLLTLKKTISNLPISKEGQINHHRFRHSFASNLIRAKVNIKAVQQLMRHESVDITLNTYTHLIQDDLTEAANAI